MNSIIFPQRRHDELFFTLAGCKFFHTRETRVQCDVQPGRSRD
jgi:hypothetical protein